MHDGVVLSVGPDPASGSAAERIALRRHVLEWRDKWSIEAEARLSQLCFEKARDIVRWAAGLRFHQLAAARTGVIDYPELPQIVADAEKLAEWVVDRAREDLHKIIAHHLAIGAEAGQADTLRNFGSGELLAIGRGVVPFAAAGALLAALPALATTTTVTMFGLITTSTISLPILAVGAAGVGVLGYFGAINIGDLRADQERVMIEAIEATIEVRLLSSQGEVQVPSLLAQLQRGLATAAAYAIETIE